MTATDHTPSRGCYQRGCRHPGCVRENYRYGKQLAAEHVSGSRRLHDTTQVRTHIERLLANNWWQAEIVRAAGVPRSNVNVIVHGQPFTNQRIALAILAISVTHVIRTDRGDRIDATGSIRRLRALAWLGHPCTDIGAATGMTDDRISYIARGKVDLVFPHEARKISAAYRTLATAPGRMKQIATAARNKGWDGPLAWDDIDDPNCRPEKLPDYKPVAENGRDSMRKAEIEHLYLLGESVASIAKQLGANEKYTSDQLATVLRERAAKARQEKAKAGLERAA